MNVVSSDEVVALIKEREDWGQLPEVKKLALAFVDSSSEASRLLNTLNDTGCLSADITIAFGRGMIFKGSEQEVVTKLKKIQRITKQTPRWMVVKMIANRLAKIYGKKKTHNFSSDKSQDLVRERVNSVDIKEWTDYYYPHECKKAARELVRILNRGDVDKTIIDEAWDQLRVMTVMTA